jgi:hypothetical protein
MGIDQFCAILSLVCSPLSIGLLSPSFFFLFSLSFPSFSLQVHFCLGERLVHAAAIQQEIRLLTIYFLYSEARPRRRNRLRLRRAPVNDSLRQNSKREGETVGEHAGM